MKEELITKAYEVAKERYAAIGVDVDAVIKQMQDFHLSLHCWQADDVMGFEKQAGPLTGGIQQPETIPAVHAISTSCARTYSRPARSFPAHTA